MNDVKKIKESVVARQLKELSSEVARDEADYPGKDELSAALFDLGVEVERGRGTLVQHWLRVLKDGGEHAELLESMAERLDWLANELRLTHGEKITGQTSGGQPAA